MLLRLHWGTAIGIFLCITMISLARGQEVMTSLHTGDAVTQDREHWSALLAEKKYDELERISNALRAEHAKYRNGRSRDWKFFWIPFLDTSDRISDEDYTTAIRQAEGWLEAYPDSTSARMLLSNLWFRYGQSARGEESAAETPVEQLQLFSERSQKAFKYIEDIEKNPSEIDNVYRTLRIQLAFGLGEKPDIQLVYDALDEDPRNMEVVRKMTGCLLPRWFGQPGELEAFAKDVVKYTESDCGAMHYADVVLALRPYLIQFVLFEHDFDVELIQQSVRDRNRLYPEARENWDSEGCLLMLTGDVAGVREVIQRIGDQPNKESWQESGMHFDTIRSRLKEGLLEGDQSRIIFDAVNGIKQILPVNDERLLVTLDEGHGLRVFETATGKRVSWQWLQDINGERATLHPVTKLIASGSLYDDPGLLVFNMNSGNGTTLDVSPQKIIASAFSRSGEQLAFADKAGRIAIYDLKVAKILQEFSIEPASLIRRLAFSVDDDRLFVAANNGDVHMFSAGDGTHLKSVHASKIAVRSLSCSKDYVATGSHSGDVVVYDSALENELARWTPKTAASVLSVAISPDQKQLAIARTPKNPNFMISDPLLIWRFQEQANPTALAGHKLGVNCVEFIDDGKTLVSGGNDFTIRFWDVADR